MEDNPFPAIMGRVCYHPCETACNRAQLDEAVGINSVERFLGDEAIEQGWTVDGRRGRRPGSGCWSSAPGRPGSRPPTTSPASATRSTDPRRRADAGRDDALRHPELPAAARRPRRRDRSGSCDIGVDARARTTGRPTSSTRCTTDGFDAVFLAVGAHIGKRAYIPAGEAARILDAVSLLRSMEGEEHAAARPPRRRLRRRQHRDGRRPHRASGSAPTKRSSSTGARATGCPPTTSRSRRPRRRASG